MDDVKKELCTIRIMFSVTSDEEAIECKKRVAEALKAKPDVQIQFALMNTPPQPTR